MFGPAELALHRADVDDLAAPARDHAARHRLADEEHAVDVGAHQLVPVRPRRTRSSGARRCMPALLTRMSIGADLGLDARDGLGHGGAIGHVEGDGMHRRRRRRAAAPPPVRAWRALRPLRTTRAPAPASPRASARPMPALEPVTSAMRPVRSKSLRTDSSLLLHEARWGDAAASHSGRCRAAASGGGAAATRSTPGSPTGDFERVRTGWPPGSGGKRWLGPRCHALCRLGREMST